MNSKVLKVILAENFLKDIYGKCPFQKLNITFVTV